MPRKSAIVRGMPPRKISSMRSANDTFVVGAFSVSSANNGVETHNTAVITVVEQHETSHQADFAVRGCTGFNILSTPCCGTIVIHRVRFFSDLNPSRPRKLRFPTKSAPSGRSRLPYTGSSDFFHHNVFRCNTKELATRCAKFSAQAGLDV